MQRVNENDICRYCGGVIKLIPAKAVYGESARRLGMEGEFVYQCQNCNARVGCHKGTMRALGNVANEVLRLKRMEAHRVFDGLWKSGRMTRTGRTAGWRGSSTCGPSAPISVGLKWISVKR